MASGGRLRVSGQVVKRWLGNPEIGIHSGIEPISRTAIENWDPKKFGQPNCTQHTFIYLKLNGSEISQILLLIEFPVIFSKVLNESFTKLWWPHDAVTPLSSALKRLAFLPWTSFRAVFDSDVISNTLSLRQCLSLLKGFSVKNLNLWINTISTSESTKNLFILNLREILNCPQIALLSLILLCF